MRKAKAVGASLIIFSVMGYFLGMSIGFNGLPSALVIGAAGGAFGSLFASVGIRAAVLPLIGIAVGFFCIVVVQFLSSATIFGIEYYVFVPLVAGVVFTLLVSLIFMVFPALQVKVFKTRPSPG